MLISYSPEARKQVMDLPEPIRVYVLKQISLQSASAHSNMPVMHMTCELPTHIYRAMKTYRPSYRIIYHFFSWDSLVVDSVKARDCDPYADGH